MRSLTRRPVFWVTFAALGVAGAVTALNLFTVALPNVSIDISMDRAGAIAAAAELSDRNGWGPDGASSAASFGQVDPEVQTYIELEAGGAEAFVEFAAAGVYQPYQWTVRRFAEGQVAESWVGFAPDGNPYGFRRVLAEDDPGSGNLDAESARGVAEASAANWVADLTEYDLLESSQETLPGGRVDHELVYERRGVSVGEGAFRLRLRVASDELAGLEHFVHVPEGFSRRYAEMRSANEAIALASTAVFVMVFVLLFAGVGTAILLRSRWIEWRTAMMWGGLTALLFGLNSANALPLAWMGYDTALSSSMFAFQAIAASGAIAILGTPILGFFYLAGESLGRRAFPDHLQQWRFWSRDVARSNTALGMTAAAYLLVGLQVGYVVLFYMGTSRLEGWWAPADALVQPDLLATYFPWLQAVSVSLFAAMWEESVFRAVPIACAALIGAKFGRRNAWIWGMVLVQAVVFAAGHANYPQQPAYARVIELSVPAIAWGAVYVFFGLVPTILAHFLYDLSLISSLLFASNAAMDQAVVVAVGLVPLGVVLWARRGGATSRPPESAFNRAWSPPKGTSAPMEPDAPPDQEGAPGTGRRGSEEDSAPTPFPLRPSWVVAVSVIGAALWTGSLFMGSSATRLEPSRAEAVEIGRAALQARGVDLTDREGAAYTSVSTTEGHRYVFEEAGPDAFNELLGDYLSEPRWTARFVDWGASAEERVEEYRVSIAPDGSVVRVTHQLPEARPGASLDEDAARGLARSVFAGGASAGADRYREISAEEVARPARTDWLFTFLDTELLRAVDGEARIEVRIAGDEVSDVRRYVNTPEAWERARRDERNRRGLFSGGLGMMLFLALGGSAIVAVVRWSRHGLDIGSLTGVGFTVAGAMLLGLLNGWPATAATFATSQPRAFQAGAAGFGLALISLLGAVVVGLVAALAHSWFRGSVRHRTPLWMGGGIGLFYAGVGSVAAGVVGGLPGFADYSGAEAFLPLAAIPLGSMTPYLMLTSGILLLAAAYRRFRTHPLIPSVVGFVVFAMGVLVVPTALQSPWWSWVLAGAIGTLIVYSLVRLTAALPALAPLVLGVMAATTAVEAALAGAYSGARLGGLLGALAIAGAAVTWSRALGPRPYSEAAVGSE